MDNRRKIIIVLLIVLTIVLGSTSILISQLLQNTQAPSDSSASGYGIRATRDLYDKVISIYQESPCEEFLSEEIINSRSNPGKSDLKDFSLDTLEIDGVNGFPKQCLFNFEDDGSFILSFFGYYKDSEIASSESEHMKKVTSYSLSGVQEIGENEDFKYVYGNDFSDPGRCRLNIFHKDNEFAYATVIYANTGACDASNAKNLSYDIFSILSTKFGNIILEAKQ